MSNIPHDDWGTRVQTLDKHLQKALSKVSHQENTVTIILSDHGNAYGRFVEKTLQGREETYHPLLYIILPNGAKANLGEYK